MVERRIPIPSLVGGISQQPPELRLSNQLGFGSKNVIGTVTSGLTKRPGWRHEGVLSSAGSFDNQANSKFHVLNRDDAEKYIVAAADKEIRVWDMQDPNRYDTDVSDTQVKDKTSPTPANVTYGAGGDCDYLATSDPENDLEFLSLADHTLVLNRSITPALKATLTPDVKPACVIEFPQCTYGTIYSFAISWNDGAAKERYFSYRTYASDGTPASGSGTKDIRHANLSIGADEFTSLMLHMMSSNDTSSTALAGKTNILDGSGNAVNGGRLWGASADPGENLMTSGDWTMLRIGRYVFLQNKNGDDFDVAINNGSDEKQGEVKVYKDRVQTFADLPPAGLDGWILEVRGDEDDLHALGGTYYKFVSAHAGDGYGMGSWEETTKEQIKYIIDETTMPHLFIRMADGTFQWTPLDGHTYTVSAVTKEVPSWGNRVVGDESTNRDPPFIGRPIRNMFFWKNRLGFLVDDQIILSEAGEFFNFWRTTTTQVLDSARIFTNAGENRGAKLEHAVPFADHLVVFGESKQFVLRGADAVTPTSLSVAEASSLDVLPDVAPVSLGSSVIASIPHAAGWSGVTEIHDVGTAERPRLRGVELTKICPRMIDDDVQQLVGSSAEGMAAVVTRNKAAFPYPRHRIHVYNWFDQGDERIQAAWWAIEAYPLHTIRHAAFIQDKLYLLLDTIYDWATTPQYQMTLAAMDLGMLDRSEIVLDQWVKASDCTQAANGDNTDVTLPFDVDETLSQGVPEGASGEKFLQVRTETGTTVKILAYKVGGNSRKITVEGSSLSADSRIGYLVESWAVMTPPQVRDANGHLKPDRISTMRNLELLLKESTICDVVTIPEQDWRQRTALPDRTNEYRTQWDTQQIGRPAALNAVPQLDDTFRTFIGETIDQGLVIVENSSPFNFKIISGSWDVSFHTRHQRKR